ncbi:MAG: trypsin-like peptidase domain-containing protein, partial [Planctomycetia bacterium]
DRAKARVPRCRFVSGALTNAALTDRLDSLRKGEVKTDGEPNRPALNPEVLPPDRWTQGRAALESWRTIVAEARRGVVTILDGGEPVALGTVVDADLVITKASLLPFEPRCRLGDGKVVPAEVVGGDAAWDLALLKVQADGLHAVEWADGSDAPAGSLLAAPGPDELPLAVGIVAVPLRKLAGPFPTRIVASPPATAARPEAIGSAVEGRGYWVEYVEGRLAEAGVQPGDVLLTIAGAPIRTHADLTACVRRLQAGQSVVVKVQRGRERLDLSMVLRADPRFSATGRADDFPMIFEHDLPLEATECGGPLVDRDGRVVGVSIAVGPVGGMAVAGEQVRAVVAALRDGKKPWPGERARRAAPKATSADEPVTLSLDGLKEKLAERAGRFTGLMVEYEATTEADVPPTLLTAWSMVVVRDYRERRVVAFDGAKRLSRVVVPGDQPPWLPDEEIPPDPNAPPEVVRSVVERAKAGAERKARGDSSRLLAIAGPSESRTLFDGERCFRWLEQGRRFAACPAEEFAAPADYLANQGLHPIDPKPTPAALAAQQSFRLPDALAHYTDAHLLPKTELVDGAPCVVLQAELRGVGGGMPTDLVETIWLDPKLGYAPRRWERKAAGRLLIRRENTAFDEVAPGCWLPWESTYSIGPPSWVAAKYHSSPAYTVRMRLRKARVGDLPAEWFKP